MGETTTFGREWASPWSKSTVRSSPTDPPLYCAGSESCSGWICSRVTRTLLISPADVAPGKRLRSLDAIHVASALAIEDLDALVTYDNRMAEAAEASGIAVAHPA